jgi:hypothetical protein
VIEKYNGAKHSHGVIEQLVSLHELKSEADIKQKNYCITFALESAEREINRPYQPHNFKRQIAVLVPQQLFC